MKIRNLERVRDLPEALPVPILDQMVRSTFGQKAWGCHFYLGSMFTLDFGETLRETSFRGSIVKVGTVRLSVRDAPWVMEAGSLAWQSHRVDDADKEEICQIVMGSSIESLSRRNGEIHISISSVLIRVQEEAGPGDDFSCELYVPSGDILLLRPKTGILLGPYVSTTRKSAQYQ